MRLAADHAADILASLGHAAREPPQQGRALLPHLKASDTARTAAFYRDCLGLKFLFQAPNVGFFDCGGIRLMLGQSENPDRQPAGTILYFKVDDIDTACAALALLGWLLLQSMAPHLDLPQRLWQAIVLVWRAVSALALGSAATGYLRRAGAGPEESVLYLQDQLWRDLRREQGEVERWTAWRRLRGHAREKS